MGKVEVNERPRAGAGAAGSRDIVLLAVGLGCLGGFLRMYALGFVGYLSYEVASSGDPWGPLRAVVQLGVLLLLALNGRYGWFKLGLGCLAAAAVMAVASAIVFAVDVGGAWGAAVAIAGGVGVSVLSYVWMLLLSSCEVRSVVIVALPAFVLMMLIVQGAPLVGPELALIIAVFSAFAAGACALRFDPDLSCAVSDGAVGASESLRIPWLTVAMVVACGFLVTVLFGIAQSLTWLYDWRANYGIVAFAFALVVAATAAIMLQSRGWMYIVWVPLFSLFGLAIVFSCLPVRSMIQIAVGCMMAAMFAAMCLYWMIFPALFSALKIPRAFLAGLLLLLLNPSLPSLVGEALSSLIPRSMQSLGGVSGLMAILLAMLFALSFVLNRNRLGTVGILSGESHAKPEVAAANADDAASEGVSVEPEIEKEGPVNPADALKERLEGLVEQFGLTPRESEVALYTVQGFSCAYIADKLVVSNSTVRFHQQNIYRKFEVHSRNELIEFVAAESTQEGGAL